MPLCFNIHELKNQDLQHIWLDLIQNLTLIFNKIDFMSHFNSLNFEPLNENGKNEAHQTFQLDHRKEKKQRRLLLKVH